MGVECETCELLAIGKTVLSGARFYTDVVPTLSDEAKLRIREAKGGRTLEELAEKELEDHPPRSCQTILKHPFRGGDCIWIDEPHTVDIKGTDLSEVEVKEFIAHFV